MTKNKLELHSVDDVVVHQRELEIVKAVAQAWYGHSTSSRTTDEFDANRRNFESQPSRFKLEAMKKLSSSKDTSAATPNWDFRDSLWDSYEIVAVSKKLETGLTLDNPFSGLDDKSIVRRRQRESKNSLRNLFNRLSSRRFNESQVPGKDDSISFD